ncbi:multidrug and toxin extrusion protein [Ilyonectria destructans]|nr:multidrug and toxin extrusion protein [Ilyonectria destructans]
MPTSHPIYQSRADEEAVFSEDDSKCSSENECPTPARTTRARGRRTSPASHAPAKTGVSHQLVSYTPPLQHRDEKKHRGLAARIYRLFFRASSRNEDTTIIDETGVTWQHEAKVLASHAAPLIVTFLLQYFIDISSIIAVGRLGKIELGAVSLANMSASISCFAVFQGLATSLDTLCSQAYGSGNKHLVGLYCQRMTLFLLCLSVLIALLWLNSEYIIMNLVHDADIARLASTYLHILIFALPGYAFFETGKRFLQAQGLFRATTYVLLIGAPVNAMLQWLLVWKLELGFIGAPISVVLTRTLLPILLVLYTKLFDGSECWGGFSKRALTNWWVMIRLAVPGMIMVEAEWLAFEIMTVISSRFGTEYLAAQSILITLATISYQLPFPVSIAASTRVATLIGAGRVSDAKVAARVAIASSCMCTFANFSMYMTFQYRLPFIFTDDDALATLVSLVLPLVAVMTFVDGLSVAAHGLLRGIGKQEIGGPANLVSYYLVSLPISLYLAFVLDMKIEGLWIGVTIGLILVSIIEYGFLLMTDWRKAVMEAEARNAAG